MSRKCLTVGISTRALFDLEKEHEIFELSGPAAYVDYQIKHEDDVLAPGPAFELVKSLLALNEAEGETVAEVIIISQNSADGSLRIFNSIEAYGLGITRAALTTGAPIAPYLKAFGIDLYLSADESDVSEAIKAGVAAATVLKSSATHQRQFNQIRIAFDGDCVLFSDEAEIVFMQGGVDAFDAHEKQLAALPLAPGPFAKFLEVVIGLQQCYPAESSPIRTALVTARSAPSHERVIRTLRAWGLRIDEAFFMGGRDKSAVLEAFGADIFFDDNEENTTKASLVVLAARVPMVS